MAERLGETTRWVNESFKRRDFFYLKYAHQRGDKYADGSFQSSGDWKPACAICNDVHNAMVGVGVSAGGGACSIVICPPCVKEMARMLQIALLEDNQ